MRGVASLVLIVHDPATPRTRDPDDTLTIAETGALTLVAWLPAQFQNLVSPTTRPFHKGHDVRRWLVVLYEAIDRKAEEGSRWLRPMAVKRGVEDRAWRLALMTIAAVTKGRVRNERIAEFVRESCAP